MNGTVTKILITIVVLSALILFGYGSYRYFTSPAATTTAPTGEGAGSFPTSGNAATTNDNTNQPASRTGQTGTGRSTQTQTAGENVTSRQTDITSIRVVTNRPVSGAIFVENAVPGVATSTAKKLYVRYMEQESGHIYDLGYNENVPKKISNTTITRIYKTFYNSAVSAFMLRRLDEDQNIQNIYAILEKSPTTTSESGETPVGRLNQSLLSANIKEVAVSPGLTKIFYLNDVGGVFVGTVEDFGSKPGINKKQIFNSALNSWQIQWPEANTIFFNTKPAATIPGSLYSQNITKNGLNKILGDINGLTSSVDAEAKQLIYSESINEGLRTYVYDIGARKSSASPLTTLPEKCVWGRIDKNILYCAVPSTIPRAAYPESWYQGVISFDDEIWRIDTKTGNTELIADKKTLERAGGGIDAENLVLSPNEDYLLLSNKKDSSLWQIKLK